MNFSKKNRELIRQNEEIVKKPQKHDANLQKNSTLYFQIGLILCLLASYGVLEMNFRMPSHSISIQEDLNEKTHFVYALPPKTVKKIVTVSPKKVRPTIFKTPVVKEKTDPIIETKIDPPTSEANPEGPITPPKAPAPKTAKGPVSILGVEQVPIYPGCESAVTNKERRQCLDEKITKLVKRKFDTDIAAELGLKGVQNIYVVFKIDKTGNVVILKTRAAHERLEKEASRVVNKIPVMIPGRQSDQNVDVIYNLPIRFQIVY
jgi:protein TonB